MSELDDHRLLAEFVRCRSEAAFTELVRRYAGLVYSTAFRFCNNPHHAEEITQAVFIILARKAETLSRHVVLSGWLYQTARLTAANFVKGEIRRRHREQEAVMQSNLLETDSTGWEKIAPLLDTAIGALGETDRNAVLLRYFENRTSSEIGVALRMNEETARKRVNRALEKLRHFFVKRGVTVSSAALSGAISANSVQPISAFMVKSISAVALAKGAAASTSTLTLAKGALKIMAWTKAKTAIVVGVSVLLAAGTATVVIHPMHMGSSQPILQTLALKVDPDLFIKNIMAEMDSTMNTPSNHWSNILLDLLRIQGVNCNPPCGIAFNTKTGEITTRNKPEALEKLRQPVEELNQLDGRCDLVSRIPVKQKILFTARFYKMSPSDFDKLGLGQPNAKATRNESGWWMLEPKSLNKLNQNLRSYGFEPFQAPRIDTGYGIAGDLYVGTSAQNIGFKCLPIALVDDPFGKEQMIDLKVQVRTTGYFTSNPAGDWPDFADRTNCALFAEANVENGGVLVFRAQNPWGSANNELVVLIEAAIKTTK